PSLPSQFCFWELKSNFPVGHPSWDCSSPNSLNFGVPKTPKPVSSQKASPRRHTKLSHPGIDFVVSRYCPLWAPLSTLTVLFRGTHDQLPSGSPILGLL
ncbi:unnamed protein product, partial [Prunus brigantina]